MSSNSGRLLAWSLCVLGLASLAVWTGCTRRTADGDMSAQALAGYTEVSLADLNASPKEFVDRKVCFEAYFACKSDFYQPFRTQFTGDEYVNFTVWPSGARLWLAKEIENSLPYLYVAKDAGGIIEKNPERLLEKLDGFKRYQQVRIYGTVASDYGRAAWIVVDAFRPVRKAGYTGDTIRRLQLATERYDQKLFALAAKDFSSALAMSVPPEIEGGIRRSLGLSQLAVGNYAEAATELSTAERLGAADAAVYVGLAEAQIELGRFAAAEKSARAALVKDPKSILGRAHLAVALGGQKKVASGLDECADALKLAPGDADVLRAQGLVFDLAGPDRLDAAIESYRQAVLARATDARIQRELGQLYMKKPDYEKAKGYFENVINLSKADDLGYCRGCCLLATAQEGLKKPEDAVNSYKLALQRDDRYIPAYLGLGSLYAAGGREKEAIEQFMVVAKTLDPKGENGFVAWKRSAELYRAKPENMAKAAACYFEAAKIKEDYQVLMDMASAYWEQSKPDRDKVAEAYRRAAAANPTEITPLYRLGVVLNEQGKAAEAAAALEAAKRGDPTNVPTLLRLGQTYRRLCKDREALQEFEAAAAIDSKDLDVKNSLAYALADAGRADGLVRAGQLAAEAVTAKPGEAAYLDTLGWVQVKKQQAKDAVATLEKAANASSDADVLYHLGCAYSADRQYDKAVDTFSKAEIKLRQGKMSCESCKRLLVAVQKSLAGAKQDKARAEAAAAKAAPKTAPKAPADVKKLAPVKTAPAPVRK